MADLMGINRVIVIRDFHDKETLPEKRLDAVVENLEKNGFVQIFDDGFVAVYSHPTNRNENRNTTIYFNSVFRAIVVTLMVKEPE